jgi:hypothetical protein
MIPLRRSGFICRLTCTENRIIGNGEKCFEALWSMMLEALVDIVDNSK